MNRHIAKIFILLLALMISLSACSDISADGRTWTVQSDLSAYDEAADEEKTEGGAASAQAVSGLSEEEEIVTLDHLPDYDGSAYVAVNGNSPFFEDADKQRTDAFETYSELDELGRCGVAYANICVELMPTEQRGEIGQIKPSGWQTVKYDCVEGKYLYNRCHLIGFQLAGENANEKNLITGTRYLNIQGMLPFENLVADYVKETEQHVLYRVTPIFEGENLVASGVLMEGWSVEDRGESVCFCVYAYNVQPEIEINYADGASRFREKTENNTADDSESTAEEQNYVLNTSSLKFHLPDCSGAASISEQNRQDYTGAREHLIEEGYTPCGRCKP